HLDRRLAVTSRTCRALPRFRSGDQQRRKPSSRGALLLTPAINLPRRNINTASDLGDDSSRRETLRDNRPLLVLAPAPSTLNAGDHLNSRHRSSLAPVQTLSFAPVLCRRTTQSARRPPPDGYDVLARIAEYPAHRIDELLPSNWRPESTRRRPD